MTRTLFLATAAAALFAAASPVSAAVDPEVHSFTRDGRTYHYTISEADGRRVIEGRTGHRRFRLVVNGDRVTGSFDGRPVSFAVPETATAERARPIEIAAQ